MIQSVLWKAKPDMCISVPMPVQKGSSSLSVNGAMEVPGELLPPLLGGGRGGVGGARHRVSHDAQCGSLGCQMVSSCVR